MNQSAKSFKAALLKEENNLRRFAYSLTWNTEAAEDLLQDTFLRAMLKRETFSYGRNFKSWIFTVMRHIFYNNYRDKKRHGEELMDEMAPGAPAMRCKTSETNTIDALFKKELCTKIMALSDEKREPFLLLAEGYKYEEIAEKLHLQMTTVKSRIHAARQELIRQIKSDDRYLNM